jgi:hypothetical protein
MCNISPRPIWNPILYFMPAKLAPPPPAAAALRRGARYGVGVRLRPASARSARHVGRLPFAGFGAGAAQGQKTKTSRRAKMAEIGQTAALSKADLSASRSERDQDQNRGGIALLQAGSGCRSGSGGIRPGADVRPGCRSPLNVGRRCNRRRLVGRTAKTSPRDLIPASFAPAPI